MKFKKGMVDKFMKDPKEWKKQLTPEEYEICINHGTEPHFLQLTSVRTIP